MNRSSKRISIVLFLMILMLTGCSGKENKTEEVSQKSGNEELVTENQTGADDRKVVIETQDQSKEEKDGQSDTETDQSNTSENNRIDGETYTWKEVSVSIPDSWTGKYKVKEYEDGFYFTQTASEESDGSGYLCGINKSNDLVNESAGSTMLAFTDDAVYYFEEPTDVNCDYDNVTTRNEYLSMMSDLYVIKDSIHIDQDNVKQANEYMIPRSDVQNIPDDILENMDLDHLWLARNEIYARHGRDFTNSYLQSYFACCPWYDPTIKPDDFDENVLSQIEKDNLKKIKAQEEELESLVTYPVRYDIGKVFEEDLNGDGKKEKVKFEFGKVDENSYTGYLTIDGNKYDVLEGNQERFLSPNLDGIYVTDIAGYAPGLELAIMDEGPSADPTTYFFTYTDNVHSIGCIDGYPFKEYMGINGFSMEGGVTSLQRADVISSCFAYSYWWYDQDNGNLVLQDSGMRRMAESDACNHELYVDLPIYIAPTDSSKKIIMKAQKSVSFIETDGKEWIKVRGKDGVVGYFKGNSDKIEGTDLSPDQVFSNLSYFG